MAENKPRVYRAPSVATWKLTDKWGPNLGDITEFTVTRTPGHSLQIVYGNYKITVPEKMVGWFADSVAQAADWEDPGE